MRICRCIGLAFRADKCTHENPGTPQAQGQSVPSAQPSVKTYGLGRCRTVPPGPAGGSHRRPQPWLTATTTITTIAVSATVNAVSR
jgi:hypothetical protein